MLIIFTRAILIYIFLLITMRLMGKRQLGELQPFEFAITIIIAELACIPMSDTSIPIAYGLVPIFTLFVAHLFITKLASVSIIFRKFLNGKPVIVIDNMGINAGVLNSVDMNISDLMDSLRAQGYFNPDDIAYAILETNGSLSLLPKGSMRPLTPKDLNIEVAQSSLGYTLVCEGKLMMENIKLAGIDEATVLKALAHYKLKVKNVLLMLLEDGDKLFIQPYIGKSLTDVFTNVIVNSVTDAPIEGARKIKRYYS